MRTLRQERRYWIALITYKTMSARKKCAQENGIVPVVVSVYCNGNSTQIIPVNTGNTPILKPAGRASAYVTFRGYLFCVCLLAHVPTHTILKCNLGGTGPWRTVTPVTRNEHYVLHFKVS